MTSALIGYWASTAAKSGRGLLTLADKKNWPLCHFSYEELQDPPTGTMKIEYDAAIRLDWLRDRYRKPIVIRPGGAYRTLAYNKSIGGAVNSYHLKGKAFDIHTKNATEAMVLLELARDVGFTGFGVYSSFLHIDTGAARLFRGSK